MTWRTAAALIFVGVALPAWADNIGSSSLDVCNHGTVTAEVVVASNFSHLVHPWVVEGKSIAPGECKGVYAHRLGQAFIGFAWFDSRGRWVAGTVESLPDLGTKDQGLLAKRTPVLSRTRRMLCVRRDKTWYGIRHNEDFPASCDGFRPASDEGTGAYVPLEAVLWFDPEPSHWYGSGPSGGGWLGGDYYLNIAPGKSGSDVHATVGTASGRDAPPPPPAPPPPQVDPEERRKREEAEYAKRFLADKARTDALRRSVSDFKPDWVGQALIVKGTISAVQVQMPWAIFHFSDAPGDGLVICVPAYLLRGVNTTELVGKTLEFRGMVAKPSCLREAAGIRVIVWHEG